MKKPAKGWVLVTEEYCKGCACCTVACPEGLLKVGSHINTFGYNSAVFFDDEGACRACLLCARFCPDAAIEVYSADSKDQDQGSSTTSSHSELSPCPKEED